MLALGDRVCVARRHMLPHSPIPYSRALLQVSPRGGEFKQRAGGAGEESLGMMLEARVQRDGCARPGVEPTFTLPLSSLTRRCYSCPQCDRRVRGIRDHLSA